MRGSSLRRNSMDLMRLSVNRVRLDAVLDGESCDARLPVLIWFAGMAMLVRDTSAIVC